MKYLNKFFCLLALTTCILFQTTGFISHASKINSKQDININMEDTKIFLGDSSHITISFKKGKVADSLILTQICYDVTQKTILNYNSKTNLYEGDIKYKIEPEALSVWSIKNIILKTNNKTKTLNTNDLKNMGLNLTNYDVKQNYIIDNNAHAILNNKNALSSEKYTRSVSVPTKNIDFTNDEFSNSTKVSQTNFPNQSNTVIVVRSSSSVDGVCVSPLAKVYNAPILYTSKDNVPTVVMDEIKRLNPQNIILIGSTSSVSENVYNQLINYNSNTKTKVNRIGGKDRFETSLLIAKEIDKVTDVSKVFMVNGYSGIQYTSAIAQRAIKEKQPIILTKKYQIPTNTYNWLQSENLKSAYYIGNSTYISNTVIKNMDKITDLSSDESNRVIGNTLAEVTANVLCKFYPSLNYNSLVVVRSNSLKDILLAESLATLNNSLILNVNENNLDDCYEYIINAKKVNKIYTLGKSIDNSIIEKIAYNMSIHKYGKYTVVLDAGHGGLPGSGWNWGGTTIVNSSLWEKTYNLQTTLAATKYLENHGVNVVLTRSKEVYVPLYKRTSIINTIKPDLAISIHYNSLTASSNGTSVYYKYAERNGGLTKTLANNILNSIIDEFHFAKEGVKYKTYIDRNTGKRVDYMFMIRESKYPTVLVETCYLSNINDQAKVNTKFKREIVGHQISKGILKTLDYMDK